VADSSERTRLLIATGAAAAAVEDVPPLVRALIATASEVLVMTPVLTSRLRWIASDTDQARYEADERLGVVLGHVEAIAPGAETTAAVGDETPMTAFDDAIRAFRPDHLLIALRAGDHSAWQERHLLDRVRERFHVPLTVFELDRAGRATATPAE
jgi:hypothetical protein